MRAWLLSVVGIVFMGIMVDVISPEGKTNTFIKSVFAIVLLYVMINPIVAYFNSGVKLNTSVTWKTDEELLNVIEEQRTEELRLRIVGALTESGYSQYDVEISGNMEDNKFNVSKINVYLVDDVLSNMDKHINNSKVIQIIADIANVSKEVVVFE